MVSFQTPTWASNIVASQVMKKRWYQKTATIVNYRVIVIMNKASKQVIVGKSESSFHKIKSDNFIWWVITRSIINYLSNWDMYYIHRPTQSSRTLLCWLQVSAVSLKLYTNNTAAVLWHKPCCNIICNYTPTVGFSTTAAAATVLILIVIHL